jgi:hypothetical protein
MRRAPQLGQNPRPLTTEGDEFLSVVGIAAHAQEAVLQPSTLQVVLELALNVARQAAAGCAQRGEKLPVMTLDDLIQQRRFWAVARIMRSSRTRCALRFLQARQCSEGQGYYFSQPLNTGDFANFVKTRASPPPRGDHRIRIAAATG